MWFKAKRNWILLLISMRVFCLVSIVPLNEKYLYLQDKVPWCPVAAHMDDSYSPQPGNLSWMAGTHSTFTKFCSLKKSPKHLWNKNTILCLLPWFYAERNWISHLLYSMFLVSMFGCPHSKGVTERDKALEFHPLEVLLFPRTQSVPKPQRSLGNPFHFPREGKPSPICHLPL